MKRQTVIQLSEKEAAEILAKHFELDKNSATLDVHKFEGNQREPSYTKLILKASHV